MLLCFGDSNCWGWDPAGGRHAAALRWPDRLARRLGQPLHNLGQPGRTLAFNDAARGLVSARDQWQAALTAQPAYLVLALGINDLAAGGSPDGIGQALDSYLEDWQAAGRPGQLQLLAPAPIPALQGPWRNLFGHHSAQAPALLPLWQAAARHWRLACLDPSAMLGSSQDGLHWTAEAHGAIAQALGDAFAGASVGPAEGAG
ncbi:GDSL-type esterase/lipase family protein [Pseudaeromonas sp. ZJS20]|uniref:GDSL-type esterase/lipase family protein n=1 Tax=Pseudaeromonas aegiceratis TaxID=3153928 RepID=UPI00390C9D56